MFSVFFLKVIMLVDWRMSNGSLFHVRGPCDWDRSVAHSSTCMRNIKRATCYNLPWFSWIKVCVYKAMKATLLSCRCFMCMYFRRSGDRGWRCWRWRQRDRRWLYWPSRCGSVGRCFVQTWLRPMHRLYLPRRSPDPLYGRLVSAAELRVGTDRRRMLSVPMSWCQRRDYLRISGYVRTSVVLVHIC